MRSMKRLIGVAAVVATTISCGDLVRLGKSPVYLVIESLQAVRGGSSGAELSSTLYSDVLTLVTTPAPCTPDAPCPTIFSDSGQVVMRISLKDLGSGVTPSAPSLNNEVTITRYRVSYRRADGRNTPGVDVPHGFDGAVTGTIPTNSAASLGFELVRHVAKMEAPLVQLAFSSTIIATIADITFYGRDQVGNEISATGSILVEFGNFGDE